MARPGRPSARPSPKLACVQREQVVLGRDRQRIRDCADPELRELLQRIERARLGRIRRLLTGPSAFPPNPGEPAPPASGQRRMAVSERRLVTDDLLIFKAPRPPDFQFTAGQYVKLGVGNLRRSYSLVSAPHEPFLEFFVELIPEGAMSDRLRELAAGDSVELSEAKGGLTLDEGFPNHLMIATVTGINPFVSILRDHFHRGRRGQRFYLLQGASFQDEFGYREELEGLARAHPEILTYIPTVSRPAEPRNAGWSGEQGRVDTIVDRYREQFGLVPDTTMVYACGNPGMVDEIEQLLAAQGFRVQVERYT